MMMLPLYAQTIADARQRGERPDSVVFVSFGNLGVRAALSGNWCVVVMPQVSVGKLDFSWCIALDIEVAAQHVKANPRCVAVCEAILANAPRNLVVWETATGCRWWLKDELGPWPKPFLLGELDRSLMPKEPTYALCA